MFYQKWENYLLYKMFSPFRGIQYTSELNTEYSGLWQLHKLEVYNNTHTRPACWLWRWMETIEEMWNKTPNKQLWQQWLYHAQPESRTVRL